MYERIISRIYEADTVAIFMHINPDGDCVSSSLAVYKMMLNMGKKPYIFLEEGNTIRSNLSFLPNFDKINADSLKRYDLGFCVDCGAQGRLGLNCYKIFSTKCDQCICVDHHASSTPFVEDLVLEPKASSTTQILYKVFCEIGKQYIDKDIATLLFAGLWTDSGGLSFSSVTSEAYKIAYELSLYGIDIYALNRKLSKDTEKGVFDLRNRVLSKCQFYNNNQTGIITFMPEDFAETGTEPPDTDGIINYVIDIIDVKIAISIMATDGHTFKIGIRTKDGVDASACAGYFGGGGHYNASGCRIYATYEETLSKLLEMTAIMLKND